MSATQWRCRIRQGSVRPKPGVAVLAPVVPLVTVAELVHDELSENLTHFAQEIAKDGQITGFALVAVNKGGQVWANVQISQGSEITRDLWPELVSRKVGEVVMQMNDWVSR